jgi:hypothetical protein
MNTIKLIQLQEVAVFLLTQHYSKDEFEIEFIMATVAGLRVVFLNDRSVLKTVYNGLNELSEKYNTSCDILPESNNIVIVLESFENGGKLDDMKTASELTEIFNQPVDCSNNKRSAFAYLLSGLKHEGVPFVDLYNLSILEALKTASRVEKQTKMSRLVSWVTNTMSKNTKT